MQTGTLLAATSAPWLARHACCPPPHAYPPAGVVLAYALLVQPSVAWLAAAMALLGCYRGVYSSALEALWADSIPPGKRCDRCGGTMPWAGGEAWVQAAAKEGHTACRRCFLTHAFDA